jgi:hypothetical protein
VLSETKPVLLTKPRKPYVPILSAVERRAYHAAHRILTHGMRAEQAMPGGYRSAVVDHIAQIIIEEFRGLKK